MTVTRETLRQYLYTALGEWKSETSTSNGGSSGETVVCSGLIGEGDDYRKDHWVVLPDGPDGKSSYEARQLSGSTSSTGTLTASGYTNFSAQVVSGVTFQVHRYNPSDIHDALNAVRRKAYGEGLFAEKRDESLIVDDLLSAGGFETDSGNADPRFAGWTQVGSPTVTQETSIIRHGTGSAKVVASGAAGQLTQTPQINVTELIGETIKLWPYGYATAADTLRARLDWDGGTTFENGTYHTGEDEWQWNDLKVEASVPSTATQVGGILEVADGGTAYFDKVCLICRPVYQYTMPTGIEDLYEVQMQAIDGEPTGDYVSLVGMQLPREGRILRLIGKGLLTALTGDASTFEINDAQAELVVAFAMEYFCDAQLAGPSSPTAQMDRLVMIRDTALRNQMRLLRAPGMRKSEPPLVMSEQWHVETADGTDYLILSRYRG